MPNHLASQTSPYLQQHADNPVDWYPWGEEALALAHEQNKPILLSIGYSACHWCHVMAHESFEDADVAAVMNKHFVNIKVDREERPDLDQIYQAAHYMLTKRSGGWPLTMVITPAQLPFFGGTYFPKSARHNLPAFPDLLLRVADFYRENQQAIEHQNGSLIEALGRGVMREAAIGDLNATPLASVARELQHSFDPRYGGFGEAPKFPHPAELDFCLRYYATTRDAKALHVARFTLQRMAAGGIYDQLGGGFCRYSVDQYWAIPHFEKMLYDNGPLLALFSDLYLIDQDTESARIVAETATWVMREMQAPHGGYYSTLDADSEHEEGKFYVWHPEEIRALLSEAEQAVAIPYYGFDLPPNFEERHWNPIIAKPLADLAIEHGIALDAAQSLLTSARDKLFAAREKRVHPGRDEKILVSWNALMIKGLARAARVFERPEWLASARRAADFIHATLYRDKRLLATYKDGHAHLNAYLDDYAFLLDALLELMQADFRAQDLAWASELADTLLDQFEDRECGGFFFTSHDHETLIHRPKPAHDNAMPSGNGIAIFALQRLGHLSGNLEYLKAAERALRVFYPTALQNPTGLCSVLNALGEFVEAPQMVLLTGPQLKRPAWLKTLHAGYAPHRFAIALPDDTSGLPPTLNKPHNEHVNAWVCQGVSCLAPIQNREELATLLQNS